MEGKSLIKASVGVLTCGFIVVSIMSDGTFTPGREPPTDLRQVFKGPRPYKTLSSEIGTQNSQSRDTLARKAGIFNPIIRAAADLYEVDPALVKAIIMAESKYNPAAISEKGARGLMQLMPNTAHALGVKDPLDPEHNIYGGVKHLRRLLNRFEGDMMLAVAAYNAGSKNVKRYNGVPPFGTTRYYVKKVFDYYRQYKAEMGWWSDDV